MSSDTHTHDDEVPVPHFKEQLWNELAALHAQRSTTQPGQDAPVELAPSQRRRPGRRSMLVGAGAIAAAAALIAGIVVTQSNDDGSGGTSPGTTTPGSTSIADRIVSATQDATDDSVLHFTQHFPAHGRTYEIWWDETTGTFYSTTTRDADGTVLEESGGLIGPILGDAGDECTVVIDDTGGAEDSTAVNDDPPTHEECAAVVEDPSLGDEPDTRTVIHCERSFTGDVGMGGWDDVSTWLEEALASGEVVEEGPEVVDGQELTRLRLTESGDKLWIDPATQRLVRSHHGSGADETVETYEYLPRGADLLATLVAPAAPAGYADLDLLPPEDGTPEELGQLEPFPVAICAD